MDQEPFYPCLHLVLGTAVETQMLSSNLHFDSRDTMNSHDEHMLLFVRILCFTLYAKLG